MNEKLKYVNLGELELEIMDLLWDRRASTVKDIHEHLLDRREIAYTTVMTVMARLAEKGVLKRTQAGRTYVYRTIYSRHEIAGSFMDRVKNKIFRGSLEGMFSYMLSQDSFSPDDLGKLREIIEKREKMPNE
jgi:BlaI family transcriptional regulator, penicillinase repressor